MKRKLKWLAIVLAVSLLGFGTALFLRPRDRITPESWKQIRVGMTEKEVETILGSRGMNDEEYHDRMSVLRKNGQSPIHDDMSLDEGDLFPATYSKTWMGRRGYLEIYFDRASHVTGKLFQGFHLQNASFIDRLRDWLGL